MRTARSRSWCLAALALSGCSRFLDPDPSLLPPPETEGLDEHASPGSFDPCPTIRVEPAIALSASAQGTGDPHVAWNEDADEFLVVWREDDRALARLLDAEGRTVGLEVVVSRPDQLIDADPGAVGVPGLEVPGYFLALKSGESLELQRYRPHALTEDPGATQEVLTEALASARTAPALAWDGERLGVAYQRNDQQARVVSYEKTNADVLECVHGGQECLDTALLPGQQPALGWLSGSWIMSVLYRSELSFVRLPRPVEGEAIPDSALETYVLGVPLSAARIASTDRRLAVAFRGAGQTNTTQVWQLAEGSDPQATSCILATQDLTDGIPAPAWGHGRRIAVAGLRARANGDRDVVLVRADAALLPTATVQEGCPAPSLDPVQISQGARAASPDLVFSGDGYGLVWAQAPSDDDDAPADVYFAFARCAP